MWFCLCDPMFSRFSRTQICDTDRETQGHSIYRASISSRGKIVEDRNAVRQGLCELLKLADGQMDMLITIGLPCCLMESGDSRGVINI